MKIASLMTNQYNRLNPQSSPQNSLRGGLQRNSQDNLQDRSQGGSYNSCRPKPQSFGAIKPGESKFFKPVIDFYNNMCEGVAKHFTPKLVNSRFIRWFATKTQNTKNLFKHMLAVGSAITSGAYIATTLKNDQLDKDRKNTLAINQLLTLAISLVGSYTVEFALDNWWSGVTAKYAAIHLKDDKIVSEFEKAKAAKKSFRLGDYIKKNKAIYGKDLAKIVGNRVDGMGKFKSVVIFGAIFRYIVPVAVTPLANILGDQYLEKKKREKAAKKAQSS